MSRPAQVIKAGTPAHGVKHLVSRGRVDYLSPVDCPPVKDRHGRPVHLIPLDVTSKPPPALLPVRAEGHPGYPAINPTQAPRGEGDPCPSACRAVRRAPRYFDAVHVPADYRRRAAG